MAKGKRAHRADGRPVPGGASIRLALYLGSVALAVLVSLLAPHEARAFMCGAGGEDDGLKVGNTACGNNAVAHEPGGTAEGNTAVGVNSKAGGDNGFNTAIGRDALASGTGSGNVALGRADAHGNQSANVASGYHADASGDSIRDDDPVLGSPTYRSANVATGYGANAKGVNANNVATGYRADAQGSSANNIAHGYQADASGISSNNIAIGSHATASGSVSTNIAFGNSAISSGGDSLALGNDAAASAAGSVALGTGSVADKADTVSVGKAGAERRVVNVATGIDGTDAVNVDQLNTALAGLGGGGGADANAVHYDAGRTGVTINPGSTALGIHNVAEGKVEAGSTDAVNGSQLAAVGMAAGNAQATADTANGTASKALALGRNAVQYDDDAHSGVTLTGPGGGPIGIHNVAVGVVGTDAVNLDQLNLALSGLGGGGAGGGSDANAVHYDAGRSGVTINPGSTALSVHNVAEGKVGLGSTDVVNGGQLHAVQQEVDDHETRIAGNTKTLGQHTTQIASLDTRVTANTSSISALDTRVTTNTDGISALDGRVGSLENSFASLSSDIGETRTEARQGIAAAIAMTTAPMPSAAGRTSWAANVGFFKGETAFGASMAHRLDLFDNPFAFTAGYAYGGGSSHALRVGLAGEF